jgi:GntR family transcriptional repressor for pyruvate dehydrogenase complex
LASGIEPADRGRSTLLSDFVFERLHHAISAGDYGDDERLPSEKTLAERFEVSRPVVRDALRRLREQGLVYSRQGSGSYVRILGVKTPLAFAPLETIADLQRCYEFRLSVEPAAAARAAERRSAADLDAIGAALQLMHDATGQRRHREDADFDFHLAIAMAAHNRYFETAMRALRDHITVGMKFHGRSLLSEQGGLGGVQQEHAAIFAAIRDRQAEAAEAAMLDHVAGSRDRIFEGRLLDLSPPEA